MEPRDEQVLTVDDVAALIGAPRGIVLSAIRRGELVAKKLGSSYSYRIMRTEYERWVSAPTPPKGKEQS
jgi:excisionase family DNA binding protein